MKILGGRWPWVVLVLVLALALGFGSVPRSPTLTLTQRVDQIASGVRCPSCSGLSASESSASTAVAIRDYIRQQLERGQTPAQIDDYLVSRYGSGILLKPASTGVVGLVWFIPMVAGLVAAAGLTAIFWRRRSRAGGLSSEEDARLVDAALAARKGET